MRRKFLLVLAASQLPVVIGSWLWFHTHHPLGNLLTGDASGMLLAWGRLSGLLLALAIFLQLMLIGRIGWIERAYGLDRLTRLHHVVGFMLVGLLLAHPVLLAFGHAAQADTGFWAQCRDFVVSWRGVLSAVVGAGLIGVSTAVSVAVLRRRVRYEAWYAAHLTLYAALGLTWLHQVAVGSDLTDHPAFKAYWCALVVFVFANVALYRFVRPAVLFARHRFRVAGVGAETDEVTSVMIEGDAMPGFRVEAGQFLIVRFLARGFWWEAHPFSVSNCPDGNGLRLSIKRVGDFTRRVPSLKPGTPVLVDGPHGCFTSARCASSKVLLVAGGIGITPIRALAEEMIRDGRDVILVYAGRSLAGLAFKRELDTLSARSAGRMRVVYVLSGEPGWAGERGRVDGGRLARLAPDLRERDVYLCGPHPLMCDLRRAVSALGVPSARIHDERFAL